MRKKNFSFETSSLHLAGPQPLGHGKTEWDSPGRQGGGVQGPDENAGLAGHSQDRGTKGLPGQSCHISLQPVLQRGHYSAAKKGLETESKQEHEGSEELSTVRGKSREESSLPRAGVLWDTVR